MTLLEFIASGKRNEWLKEPGIAYYVRRSIFFPGSIELATCQAAPKSKVPGFWNFLRRYEDAVPFTMEQVLNEDIAAFMRKRGWLEKLLGPTPQFASPLMVETYKDRERFKLLWLDQRVESVP